MTRSLMVAGLAGVLLSWTGCASDATDVGGAACGVDGDCRAGQSCLGGRCVATPCGDAGACAAGQSCLGGRCVDPAERCRDDDDCPGGRCVDGECFANDCSEGEERACENACGSGVQRCVGGVFRPCTARASGEVCDGEDNDCDGASDELLDCQGCTEGATRGCETECGSGSEQCIGEQWRGCDAPRARVEVCGTGVDEDCDGRVDEGCEGCTDGETRRCETECGEGEETCSDATFGGCDAPLPGDEFCDGRDNDCDGRSDEGVVRDCGNNCGAGTETCADGVWGGCTAPENCACDEGVPPDVQICGACGFRQRVCEGGTWAAWAACDEGEAQCQPGEVEMGSCGNCGTRRRACTAQCRWGEWSGCAAELECAAGAEETRACEGGCGEQTRICAGRCTWGEWSACGGGGALACAPGETEEEPCGDCGTRRRSCEGCAWGEWGACEGEGACAPGDEESEACDANTARTRTCDDACRWGAFGMCSGDQCAPGETQSQACGNCGMRTRRCTDARVWGAYGACEGQGPCAPGAVDERACGSEVGACEAGVEARTCDGQCRWSAFGQCRGAVGPAAEVCGDRIDQDCDGVVARRPDVWEPNDTCAACRMLEGGMPDPNVFLRGTIDSYADVDFYCFVAEDGFNAPGFGEEIIVALEDVAPGQDYDIFLYRSQADCAAGNELASSTAFDDADELIEWSESLNVEDGGTYVVEVRSVGDDHDCAREYRLTVNGLN
ncbi:MAG: MopE-related protein [bacterium]